MSAARVDRGRSAACRARAPVPGRSRRAFCEQFGAVVTTGAALPAQLKNAASANGSPAARAMHCTANPRARQGLASAPIGPRFPSGNDPHPAPLDRRPRAAFHMQSEQPVASAPGQAQPSSSASAPGVGNTAHPVAAVPAAGTAPAGAGAASDSGSVLSAFGLSPLAAVPLPEARPSRPVGPTGEALSALWSRAGLDVVLGSEAVVGAIEKAGAASATADAPEAAHVDRIVPTLNAVARELASTMLRAMGAPPSPYDEAAAAESASRAVARVTSSSTAIEAVAVAAATSQIMRAIQRRPPSQITSRRAAGCADMAQQALNLDAEQVSLLAEHIRANRAEKRPRDDAGQQDDYGGANPPSSATTAAASPDAPASSSSSSSLGPASTSLEEDLRIVSPAVAARFAAKRARVAVDAALIPPANVASDNGASAFALWAADQLCSLAKQSFQTGTAGDVDASQALAEPDVALLLLRRWTCLPHQERAKWTGRALTLAAAGALRPVAGSTLEPAEQAHGRAAAALSKALSSDPGTPPLATVGGSVSAKEVKPFLDGDVASAVFAAAEADTMTAAAIAGMPRTDDLPHVPTRAFCQFVRSARSRIAPAQRGFASNAEFIGAMREAWASDPTEQDRVALAQSNFAKVVATRSERLAKWVRTTESSTRQELRDAFAEAFDAAGAPLPAGLGHQGAAAAEGGNGPPRQPLTPFLAFAVGVRRQMRLGAPGAVPADAPVRATELAVRDGTEMQAIGREWRALAPKQRAAFEDVARCDSVRFATEQRAWEARCAIEAAEAALA